MKKIKLVILVLSLTLVLVGCDFFNRLQITTTTASTGVSDSTTVVTTTTTSSINSTTTETVDELYETLNYIYNLAVEASAFSGTYEEWLETVRGPQGLPGAAGKEVTLKVESGYIKWQYVGDSSWTNLIDLELLKGEDGTDGKEAVFRVSDNYIQWQYSGDLNWSNLISLDQLKGAAGIAGTDGREIVLDVADGYIKWQYQGDDTWTELISVSSLIGPSGLGIVSAEINTSGELILTMSDQSLINAGVVFDSGSMPDDLLARIEVLEAQIQALQAQIEAIDIQSQLSDLLVQATNSVVGVHTFLQGYELGSGSGVIYKNISGTYYVATNYHVVEDGDGFTVFLPDNSEVEATLVGYDYYLDLAVLTFSSDAMFDVSSFGDSNLVKPGDFIVAVGSPLGTLNYNSTTFGIVSGINRLLYDDWDLYFGELFIQHDASINPGNSGGPLFNMEGEVIGINTAKFVDEAVEGMGFAIPSNAVVNVLQYIENGEAYERPGLWYEYLINVNAIRNEPDNYPDYNVPISIINGVYVVNPDPDGVLGLAGIQNGDIILRIDGVTVSFWYEVEHQIYYQNTKDDNIVFTVYRNNQVLELVYDHTDYAQDYFTFQAVSFASGSSYFGEMYGEYLHGYGIYFFSNGDYYVGGFSYNEYYGQGIYFYADGSYYEAIWIDENNSSSGVLYDTDGTPIYGTFVDGVFVDAVILFDESNTLTAGGYQYYEIVLTETTTISAFTTGNLDTYGYLTDEFDNIIDENDDSGESYNFSITYTLDPGTYYVYVYGYDDTVSGDYQIKIILF
jgi:S1-C subfamily serine protease